MLQLYVATLQKPIGPHTDQSTMIHVMGSFKCLFVSCVSANITIISFSLLYYHSANTVGDHGDHYPWNNILILEY
jgi:hypothetical protein